MNIINGKNMNCQSKNTILKLFNPKVNTCFFFFFKVAPWARKRKEDYRNIPHNYKSTDNKQSSSYTGYNQNNNNSSNNNRMSNMDKASFESLINQLKATQESIGEAKDWILGRPEIISGLIQVIVNFTGKAKDFSKAICVLYLVNDVLHHTKGSNSKFAATLQPQLFSLLSTAVSKAKGSDTKQVFDLMEIWKQKGFYESEIIDNISRQLGQSSMSVKTCT